MFGRADDAPTGPVELPATATPVASTTTAGRVESPRAGTGRHGTRRDAAERDEAERDEARPDAAERASDDHGRGLPSSPTLLQQMGGVSGVVASSLPAIVFVVVQALFAALVVSIVASVASSLAVAVWRLVRGEALQPAFAGLFGVAACAFAAWRTGEAKGFFLLGIWTSLIYGAVFLVSVLARWPLVGVIWHGVNGDGQGWRRNPVALRAFTLASLAWVLVFGARFVVQRWLYDSALAEDWLGWVRIVMGIPLAALAALVTVWAIRRSTAVQAA